MIYLYYNKKAHNNEIPEKLIPIVKKLEKEWNEKIEILSSDCDWNEEFLKHKEGDKAILAGGDGTINHFINHANLSFLHIPLYSLQLGTGNDFYNDQRENVDKNGLVLLNDILKNLPTIEVNGIKQKFINGIGFGIDGDCCVKAEQLKANGKKKINYTKITISLLLKTYKPKIATIDIDGKTFTFKKSYLASAMFGKYYGGGMKIAPTQNRDGHLLSFVCFHGKSKLRTLMMFPSVFTGKHIRYKKNFFIQKGKCITVSFDKPCGLQIDGEVVENVLTYKAYIN